MPSKRKHDYIISRIFYSANTHIESFRSKENFVRKKYHTIFKGRYCHIGKLLTVYLHLTTRRDAVLLYLFG